MPTRNPSLRRAVAIALGVCAYLLVADLLLQPLYTRGVAQGVLSHLNGLSSLVGLPGFFVAQFAGLRRGHHTTPAVWSFIVVANFVLYAAGLTVVLGAWRAIASKWGARRAAPASAATTGGTGPAGGPGASGLATSGIDDAAAIGTSGTPTAAPATRTAAGGTFNSTPAPPAAALHAAGASHAVHAPPAPARRVTRRRVLATGAGVLAAGAVGYPMSVATRRFEVTRRTFPVAGLPPELAGLRLVQLTDVHHGPWIPLSHVRGVVAAANALDPDLVLLTGDYVHRSAVYIDPVADALAGLRARVGVVGVLGNHDWWESVTATRAAFARANIPLIDNARRFVTPDRRLTDRMTDRALCLAGVGDYYEDEQRYDAALGGLPGDMPRLLLSHNPDVAEDRAFLAAAPRVDLMLSGHTHGGQVYLPGLGTPVVPSRYGQKYARGLVRGPLCPVFVSRGAGHTVLPVRVAVAPEIAVIELARA